MATYANQMASGRRAKDWLGSFDLPWLTNLNIQSRFNLLLLVFSLAFILVGLSYGLGEARNNAALAESAEYRRIAELTAELRAQTLAMESAANSVIGERNKAGIAQFADLADKADHSLALLTNLPLAEQHRDDLAPLRNNLAEIGATFAKLAKASTDLGFVETEGSRGRLAESVDAIEGELKMWPNAEGLWTRMLKMRQAEKDFMLYQDANALGKHKKFANEFDFALDSAALNHSVVQSFRKLLNDYTAEMENYADIYVEQQKAITALRKSFHDLHPRIGALAEMARDGMVQSEATLSNIRRNVAWATILSGLIGGGVFVIFSLLSSRSIARPIVTLEGVMNDLARGRNDVDIPGIGRKDEIGQMAKAVQVFRDNALAVERLSKEQQNQQVQRQKRSDALEILTGDFENNAGLMVTNVHDAATDLRRTATIMGELMDETAQRANGVEVASGQASANVSTVAAAAEELSASIREISRLVHRSTNVAQEAVAKARESTQIVNGLSSAANQISDVVNLISNIAAQTNLLALNATIEAARAGDAGKGFAVVANEVKSLATATARATGDITQRVSAIQNETHSAAEAIQAIVVTIHSIDEIAGAVAAAIEQQDAATREIAANVGNAANSSGLVSENAESLLGIADRTGQAMKELLVSAHIMAGLANEVNQKVKDFGLDVRTA